MEHLNGPAIYVCTCIVYDGMVYCILGNTVLNMTKLFLYFRLNKKMFTNEENDSLWLYDVLDYIGANEEFRNTCRCTYISAEIMATFDYVNSIYYFGSSCEGAITPGIIYFIVRK